MHIEFSSTLTQDDENRLAPAILKALSGVLDMLPIAYVIRVETTDQHILQHVSSQDTWAPAIPSLSDAPRQAVES